MKSDHYIKSLDGLRAIAVLSILLYHLDIPMLFPGGFIGVDIFFTISGFLITYLLIKEYELNQKIDVKNFYERRIKRLMPALYFVLAFCTLLAFAFIKKMEMREAKDSLAAIFYLSNWWQIFSEQSYFELVGRPPLLQHLWSLAIEEQFYLVWPFLFIAIYRNKGWKGLAIGSLTVGILSASLMAWLSIEYAYPESKDPSRLYFGTDTHSAGLFLGVFFATLKSVFEKTIENLPHKRYFEITAAVIFLLLIAIMQYRLEVMPLLYRGGFFIIGALAGILILIVSTYRTFLNRLLEARILTYIGKRSYSLYLWHWPIYVALRPGFEIPALPITQFIIRFLLTFMAAELSYRYIEQAFRYRFNHKWRNLKKSIVAGMGLSLVCIQVGILISNYDSKKDGVIEINPEMSNYDNQKSGNQINSIKKNWANQRCNKELARSPQLPSGTQINMYGDSVLLGAKDYISKQIVGVSIDAVVARQASEGILVIKEKIESDQLTNIVLIHFGTNGFIVEKQLRDLLFQLRNRKKVILINVYAPRKWESDNNKLIDTLSKEFTNTVVIDWNAMAKENPDFLGSDHVHPTSKGIERLSKEIRIASNLPSYQDIDLNRRIIPQSCKQ